MFWRKKKPKYQTTQVTDTNFNELVAQSEVPVLLDFYADWCGPCQTLLPTIEKLATEYEGEVEILKVNVDEQRELASVFAVRSIPSIFFIKGNTVTDKLKGLTTESTLRNKIEDLKSFAA